MLRLWGLDIVIGGTVRTRIRLAVLGLFGASILAIAVSAVSGVARAATTDPDAAAPAVTSVDCGNGISAVNYAPAAGFNPVTATPEELEANDFPPKPDDPDALAIWTKYVNSPIARNSSCSDLQPSTEEPSLSIGPQYDPVEEHSGCSKVSCSWSGNIATSQTYTNADSTWTVPFATSEAPLGSYSYSSDWVGLGIGTDASPLVQAGSDSNGDSGDNHHYDVFWQVYPLVGSQDVALVSAEDTVYVHVDYSSSAAQFHIDDETSGFNKVYTYTHSFPSLTQAEWIMERTEEDGGLPYLAKATMTFTGVRAVPSGGAWTYIGSLPHTHYDMYTCDGSIVLAYPEAISSNGEQFTDLWQAPGGGTPDSGC